VQDQHRQIELRGLMGQLWLIAGSVGRQLLVAAQVDA